MYSGKERVIKAFAHEKADRLPVFDVVNKPDMYENLLGQSNFNSEGRLCVQLAKKLGKGKTVVTVLPDTAERYFSTPLFEE